MEEQSNTSVADVLVQAQPQGENTEEEYFFSAAGNLGICINPGRKVMGEGNVLVNVGYKFIQFTQQRDGFGRLATKDPEVKSALRKRTDVFDTAEYERRSTPPEVRAKNLEASNRMLIEENALLKKLHAEKTSKAQK